MTGGGGRPKQMQMSDPDRTLVVLSVPPFGNPSPLLPVEPQYSPSCQSLDRQSPLLGNFQVRPATRRHRRSRGHLDAKQRPVTILLSRPEEGVVFGGDSNGRLRWDLALPVPATGRLIDSCEESKFSLCHSCSTDKQHFRY